MTRRRMTWMFVLVICVTAVFALRNRLLVDMGNWLDAGERPRRADFAMVLPGGMERRPFVAIAMVKAGLVGGIITNRTETDPANDEGISPTSDDLLRTVLKLRGIRDDQIQVLPGHSNSTWKDAIALSKFMEANPEVTIAIVTECYHTRRASLIFHRVLGRASQRIFFVSAPLDTVDPKTWWTTEEGLHIYLGEYSKLFFYVVTDRVVIGAVVAIVVVLVVIRITKPRLRASRQGTEKKCQEGE